jgi:hypothetical protein
MARAVPIVLAAYNEPMVQAIAGPLQPFLHPGDEVDLVSGNQMHPLSVPDLNRWQPALAARLPAGTLYAAHMSGLPKVEEAARGMSPEIRSILLDYEPNFDANFTWEFPTSLAYFDRFTAICKANGRRAVAYPSGRAIQEGSLQAYRWDYAELLRHADDAYPQTQHWASLGPGPWANALARLRGQFQQHGFDPRQITVQLTLGQGGNAIPAVQAIPRYREALAGGIRRLYLWWAPPMLGEIQQFLQAIEG